MAKCKCLTSRQRGALRALSRYLSLGFSHLLSFLGELTICRLVQNGEIIHWGLQQYVLLRSL